MIDKEFNFYFLLFRIRFLDNEEIRWIIIDGLRYLIYILLGNFDNDLSVNSLKS